MTVLQLQPSADGWYQVQGVLDFVTILVLEPAGENLINKSAVVHFDFSQVLQSNSAGVVLLLAWIRAAKKVNHQVIFHHLPQQILAMLQLSDLNTLIQNH